MPKKFILPLIILLTAAILIKHLSPNKIATSLYPVKGIDVSHHQSSIDWEEVKRQGVDFAFIKATEGSGHVDEDFLENWKQAEESGILAGAYHFFSFDSPGVSQAELYIRTVGGLSAHLRPVADVEFYGDKEGNPPPRDRVQRELADYLLALEEKYSVKPILYTTYKVYELYIKDCFDEYPLWIRNVYYPPFDKEWWFWQYSDRGRLEGISGAEGCVDLNVFRGNTEALQEMVVPQAEDEETEQGQINP